MMITADELWFGLGDWIVMLLSGHGDNTALVFLCIAESMSFHNAPCLPGTPERENES